MAAEIRFEDGATYEEFMGIWSRMVGETFLDWLRPAAGWRWLDVGCGNGAFTQLLLERTAPSAVRGIDPSEQQIAYARGRPGGGQAEFEVGVATELPYADASFDAAVMALVIFFVPDPPRGVAELKRVVRPGGSVSAYAWDMLGGGFPNDALMQEMNAIGIPPLWPPSLEASRMENLRVLWRAGGLVDVQTREISVERTFPDFDSYWATALLGPRIAPRVALLEAQRVEDLRERLRRRLGVEGQGPVRYVSRANAIQGFVPAA